ncbi:MAG TPA: stage II sporulation protein M [Alphaproteobacteria bacterium]|nr:stage II sporulation protein M [Alphaproteobacteria bacterium]
MLENILKPNWLEKEPRYAFLIGLIYSVIGIIAALIIFPRSQGIASIAFLSLLLVPSLSKILAIEEKQDSDSKKFSLKKIFKDHSDVLQVYLMLFLGIFLAYALFSLKFPNLLVNGIFDSQLNIIGVNTGQATGGLDFQSILSNNFKVLIIFAMLSLVFGAGSIFFLAWNASVWGVVFAYVTRNFDEFFLTFLQVTPHMFLEVGAYFFTIIAGGIMSQAVLREKLGSVKFKYVLKDGSVFLLVGIVLLVLGAFCEVYLYQFWA